MALIFNHRNAAAVSKRRYGRKSPHHYHGSGIFTNLIGRKLLQDGVKKLINTVSKSNIARKAVNAVQHGVTNTIKSQTQKGLEELASTVAYNIKKKQKKKNKNNNVLY